MPRTILKQVPSGQIALETGGDGVYLRFDCDCHDALPYCRAVCCSLHGIDVTEDEKKTLLEIEGPPGPPIVSFSDEGPTMARRSDGYCRCNDEQTNLCSIYEDRPATCREFHCSRGDGMRGWRLDLHRQISEE